MKIFYLANTIYNSAGLERVLIMKANLLATKYGYDVVIVTNHQKGRPTFFPLDPHVRHIDLGVNIHMPWNMGRYMRALKALIKEEKPDIVNSLVFREFTHLHELKGLVPVIMAELHFAKEGVTANMVAFQEKGTSNQMTSDNLCARILNYKTFVMNNEEYLAVVFQESWERYSASYLRIFNITDRDRWTMVGESPRYNEDFRIYQYSGLGGINYDQSGGIDIVQEGDAAYIYVGSPSKGSGDAAQDAATTTVTCFKMIFE